MSRWGEHDVTREPWPDAACHGKTSLMSVTVSARASALARERIREAKAVCATCPRRAQCLDWAMRDSDPAFGMMAGGFTPDERRAMRRQSRKAAAASRDEQARARGDHECRDGGERVGAAAGGR